MQQQLADLGELGVDDRDQGGKHRRVRGRRHLALHDATAEQPAPAHQVLRDRHTQSRTAWAEFAAMEGKHMRNQRGQLGKGRSFVRYTD